MHIMYYIRDKLAVARPVGSVPASYASAKWSQGFDPRARHILSWKMYLSSADSRRASCKLLVKEWVLDAGKLSLGGLPPNSC